MARESRRYGTHLLQRLSHDLEHAVCRNHAKFRWNIQEENSACYFWVQSEREQTLDFSLFGPDYDLTGTLHHSQC